MTRILTYRPSEDALPTPTPTVETKRFWESTLDGRLLVQRCAECGYVAYPYRDQCQECLTPFDEGSWVQASGLGTVVTYATVHRAPSPAFAQIVPYHVGIVRLDEGPQMLTHLVDIDEHLDVGTRVVVAFQRRSELVALPVWRPVEAEPSEGGPQ